MKIYLAIALLALSSTAFAQTMPEGADPALWKKALKIHRKAIIVDGHNDITTPMYDENFRLTSDSSGLFHLDGTPFHTDFARLKKGNVTGVFFSIYVSRIFAPDKGSMRRAMNLIDTVYRETEANPGKMIIATSTSDILNAKKQNKIAALMGIEGGHAIEDSLFALRDFYRLGVRYMTLTHNNTNNWADACCDRTEDGKPYMPHGGLTDFGREVIGEMNRLGMFVDLSHVSDDTMRDVLAVAKAPVMYSHSSSRAFSSHPRNVPDDVLKLVAKNGGVVMVNFYPAFLDQRNLDEETAREKRLENEIKSIAEKFKGDQKGESEALRKLFDANPIYNPTYSRIVDHIDHIRDVAGIDNVGIGSDFDGVPSLPAGIGGNEDLAVVTYEMLRRGYSEKDVLKVLGGNFMRAFREVERVAGTRKISGGGSLEKLK